MLKKLLAGLTAIALSLGMVALTAGPASAHHNTINAAVSCNTGAEGVWKVTWTVKNSESLAETITASSDTSIVPVDTVINGGATLTVVRYFSVKPTSNITLTLSAKWTNNNTNTSVGTLYASDFKSDCLPDDTSKEVPLCHYDNGQGGKWTSNTVSVNSVLNGTGHGGHGNDIIPPFDYIKQGVAGHYNGQNWTTYGQNVYNNSCADRTPTKPVITQAVCTAEGQVGGAKYVIPTITGVSYEKASSTNGPWSTVAAGEYPVADGTSVWVRAVALPNYGLVGNDNDYKWKLDFTDVDASKCVTPAAPAPTYQVCIAPGAASQASYTIPSDTGIQYQRWNGTQWVNVAAGVVNVNSFPTTIQLQAIALPGFTLVGSPTSWTFQFTTAGDCVLDATPVAPTIVDALCVEPGTGSTVGYYVINGTPGDHVIYEVQLNGGGWTVVDPATYGVKVPTVPGDELQYRVSAAPGYKLVGNATGSLTHAFADPGDCLDPASVGDPFFVDEICTVDGIGTDDGYYVVVEGENVYYEVSFDSTNGIDGTWTLVDSSTYGDQITTTPGDHVWVRAIALPGYKLADNATHVWDHTFTAAEECLDNTPVKPAIVVDQTCVEDDSGNGSYTSGSITPPTDTPHVTYYVGTVNGPFADAVALTVETPFAPGVYKVWALADEGYQLLGEGGYVVNDPDARVIKDGQLAYEIVTIHAAEPCGQLEEFPPATPVVTFVQTTCQAAGSYTLGVEEVGNEAGVIWTVSGGLPNTLGKHSVNAPGTVTVTAVPADGFGFTGMPPLVNGVPTLTWEFEFNELPDDCLPTLALTGGSIMGGALGLSALLTLGGILLITARRRGTVDMSV